MAVKGVELGSGYDAVKVNRCLYRIRKGGELVGQVRQGMDHLWYAEVGTGDRSYVAAIQRVILASEAIEEFERALYD